MRRIPAIAALAASALMVAAAITCTASAARADAPPTRVSLTFDDGYRDVYTNAAPILEADGIPATFYIVSGFLNQPFHQHMFTADVQDLARRGFQIGGHTIHHRRLTRMGPSQARREICHDRSTIAAMIGSPPTTFAYPFGAYDEQGRDVRPLVTACGYSTAREDGGLDTNPVRCVGKDDCGESIPPRDVLAIRTPPDVRQQPLSWFQDWVVRNPGKWIVFVFHRVGPDTTCGQSVTCASTVQQLADWLAAQRTAGTVTLSDIS